MHPISRSRILTATLLLALCAATLAGVSSCSLFGGKKDKIPTVRTPPKRPPAFEFKFALEYGADYTATLFTGHALTVSDENNSFVSEAPVQFDLSMDWHVQEQDAEKKDQYRIEMKVGEIVLNSEDLDPVAVSEVLPSFANLEIAMVVGSDGAVLDYYVKELENIFVSLEEEYGRKPAHMAVIQALKEEMEQTRMVNLYSFAFGFVPPAEAREEGAESKRKKVQMNLKKKDDTWEKDAPAIVLAGNVLIPLKVKYKFAELLNEPTPGLAEILLGSKQDLSAITLDPESISQFLPKRMRTNEVSSALKSLEAEGYVIYSTRAQGFEEVKTQVLGTGTITAQPRRGDAVEGALEFKQDMILSVMQKDKKDGASPAVDTK